MANQPIVLADLRISPEDMTVPVAEFGFSVTLDLSKKAKDDPGVRQLKQVVCSLLNSAGGFVVLNATDNSPSDAAIDKLKQDLTGQFITFMSEHIYNSCLELRGDSFPMSLSVYSAPQVVTLNSYFHVRSMAGNTQLHDAESIAHVMSQPSDAPICNPLDGVELVYGTPLGAKERQSLELKYWANTKKFGEYKSKFNDKEGRTRRTFFAFANMPSGGDMLVGIDENSRTKMNTIYGQEITETDEKKVAVFLDELLQSFKKNDYTMYRIWGGSKDNFLPSKKPWQIQFIPVESTQEMSRRRVIRIHVDHFPGGVFEESPESYTHDENGLIHRRSFNDWKRALPNKGLTIDLPKEAKSDIEDHKDGEKKVEEESYIAASKNETKMISPAEIETVTEHQDVKQINKSLHNRSYLSWTENNHNWGKNVKHASIEPRQNVEAFLDLCDVMKPKSIHFTPSRHSIIRSGPPQDQMKRCLAAIEDVVMCKAFAIASKHWLSMVVADHIKPPKQVMDIFVIDAECNVHLFALTADKMVEKSVRADLIISGRITRLKLQQRLGQCRFSIKLHVYDLKSETLHSAPSTKSHNVSTRDFHEVRKCLSEILLEQRTSIKHIFDNDLSIALTSQQMENVLLSGLDKYNFIEGPPGSGKTYMALHVCARYVTSEVVIIASTEPFQRFVEFQNKSDALLAAAEVDLLALITSGDLSKYKCVILDDAQNLDCAEDSWMSLFKIIQETDTRLYIFADNRYQNFKDPTNVRMRKLRRCFQDFCDDNDVPYLIKTLTNIHRNSQKVASFMKACFPQTSNSSNQVKCSRLDKGDDVEVRKLEWIISEKENNSLVAYVKSMINPGIFTIDSANSMYAPREVALLVDRGDPKEQVNVIRKLFASQYPDCPVQTADKFPVEALTIDTLDNFHGLDRQVCICLPSMTPGRDLDCDKYKTFVASRGISKVVFIVDALDVNTAKNIKVDKVTIDQRHSDPVLHVPSTLESEKNLLWYLETHEHVFDACFLMPADNTPVLVYVTDSTLHQISLSGRPTATIPLDTSHLHRPRRAVSSHSGKALAVVHFHTSWRLGPWWRTVYRSEDSWRPVTAQLDMWLWSIDWCGEDALVMLFRQEAQFVLRKYNLDNEILLTVPTDILDPWELAISCHQQIFVCDLKHCGVKVFGAGAGEGRGLVPTGGQPLVRPQGLCVEGTSGRLLVVQGEGKSRGVYCVHKAQVTCLIPGLANDICTDLYQVKYLAVGFTSGLRLYDIEELIGTRQH